jgi:sterol 3beta-glucosyltransferase
MIIKPFFGDQYFWADRIQDLNVGLSVRKLTSDKLSSTILTVLNDKKYSERAEILGRKIRSENGVKETVRYIYRDLEFARIQIANLRKWNKSDVHTGKKGLSYGLQ